MQKMTQPKLYTRGKKLWIRFSLNGEVIKKSLNIEDNKVNRKLANSQIIPQLILKVNTGEFFENDTQKIPTVKEYAEISFQLHALERKKSTIYDYESSLRLHILPSFCNIKLSNIKPSDIQLWQNKLLETLKPRRVRNIRATFNTIFEDALRDEIILKNPISKVKTPKLDNVDVQSFSLKEIKLLISKAKGELQSFVALGFFTGLRSGEMIGLKWEDVNFSRKEIYINRAIKMGIVSTPKTQNSIRTIDIIDSLLPYLQDQFKRTGKKNSYMFLNKNGQHYYDIKRIRDTKWKNLLTECNLEYRTIYQMRHSFATIMIENGEDVLWVSNMLGHLDSSITLKIYAKYKKKHEVKRAIFLENI